MRKIRASDTAPRSSRLRLTALSEAPGSTRRQIEASSGPALVNSFRPQATKAAAATRRTMNNVNALEAIFFHMPYFTLPSTRLALVPPKPKLFDKATSIFRFTALFGARSNFGVTAGLSRLIVGG